MMKEEIKNDRRARSERYEQVGEKTVVEVFETLKNLLNFEH